MSCKQEICEYEDFLDCKECVYYKVFEYCPEWIKKGVRVEVFFEDKWLKGTILQSYEENGRGIDIQTDEDHGSGNIVALMVYMCESSINDWRRRIRKI